MHQVDRYLVLRHVLGGHAQRVGIEVYRDHVRRAQNGRSDSQDAAAAAQVGHRGVLYVALLQRIQQHVRRDLGRGRVLLERDLGLLPGLDALQLGDQVLELHGDTDSRNLIVVYELRACRHYSNRQAVL